MSLVRYSRGNYFRRGKKSRKGCGKRSILTPTALLALMHKQGSKAWYEDIHTFSDFVGFIKSYFRRK